MKRFAPVGILVLGLVLAAAPQVFAAGFEVVEQGGRALGNAYAGKAASGEDATAVAFNPACMARLDQLQAAVSLQLIASRGDWRDRGSTGSPAIMPTPPSTQYPVAAYGGDGGNPGGDTWIPNVCIATPVAENVWIGFGAFSTFGLSTDYDSGTSHRQEYGWQGRYVALKSDLATRNFNVSVAGRLSDMFSIGAGLNYQEARATLTNAIDFGTIGVSYQIPGLVPERDDGRAKIDADWADSWGWNAGILIEFSPETRFGIAYRSEVDHTLRGRARFRVPELDPQYQLPPLTTLLGGMFTNTKAKAKTTIPDQACISAWHDLSEEWTLVADVNWTDWSSFQELKVTYANPAQPATVLDTKWDDAFRYALGAIFRPHERWTFRCGVAYDESPIRDKHRTPRIPTNDRWWFALGIGIQVAENVGFDFSWMHVWIKDGRVDNTVATGQRLKGKVSSDADVLGFQLTIDLGHPFGDPTPDGE